MSVSSALTNVRQQFFSLARDVSEFEFALIATRVSEVKEEAQSQQMGRTSSDRILPQSHGAINGGASRLAQGTAPKFGASTNNSQTLEARSQPLRFQPARMPEQPTGLPPKRRRINSTSSEEAHRGHQHTNAQPQQIQSRDLTPPPVRPHHTMRAPNSTAACVLSRRFHQSNHTIDILGSLELPGSLSSISPASNGRITHEMRRCDQQKLTTSNNASTASYPITLTNKSQLLVNPTQRNSMVGVHDALELPDSHSNISPAISPAPNARHGREMHEFEQQSSLVFNGVSIASHPIIPPITRSRLFTDCSHTNSTIDTHAALELPNSHLSISSTQNSQASHEMHESDLQNLPTSSGASTTVRSVTSTNRPRFFTNPTCGIVAQEHPGLPYSFELNRPRCLPMSITNTRIRANSEQRRPWPAVMNTPGNLSALASRCLLGGQAQQTPGNQFQQSNDDPTHTEDGLRWPLRRLERQANPPGLAAALQMQPPPQIPSMSRNQGHHSYHRRHNMSTLRRQLEPSDFESRFLLPSHGPQQRTRSPNRREPQPVHADGELDESLRQHVSRSSSNNEDISPMRISSSSIWSPVRGGRNSAGYQRSTESDRHFRIVGDWMSLPRSVVASRHFVPSGSVETLPRYLATPGPVVLAAYPVDSPPRHVQESPQCASTRLGFSGALSSLPSAFRPGSSRRPARR